MAKINMYSVAGTKTSTNLPKVFQEKVNMQLLAQAIRVYQDRMHPGLSKVKTRGEVRASTAKIWRQKGTGRARHGSISAPIFVGGGIAHGPKGVKRTLRLTKKMANKALLSALSLKAKDGNVAVVNKLADIKKTKDAKKLVDSVQIKEGLKNRGTFGVILGGSEQSATKAFRNLSSVQVEDIKTLNAYKVLTPTFLIFDKEAFENFGKVKKAEPVKDSVELKKEKKVKRSVKSKVAKKGTK